MNGVLAANHPFEQRDAATGCCHHSRRVIVHNVISDVHSTGREQRVCPGGKQTDHLLYS